MVLPGALKAAKPAADLMRRASRAAGPQRREG